MISSEQSQRIQASRRALRWWMVIARADLPPAEKQTVRIVKKAKPQCTATPTNTATPIL